VTYLEDFIPGERFRHSRGKTISTFDGAGLALLVMNSSDGHFNDHVMRDTEVGESVVFGGITLAVVVGLTMQDTAEHGLAEVGLDRVRLRAPVVHGDTLYAATEVTAVDGDVVTFNHWGFNQHGTVVIELERRVRIASRGHHG
jgi:itaconyl-CoA hydratase